MLARLSPTISQLVTACFPVAGCSVLGYSHAHGTRYCLRIGTPAGFAGPRVYEGRGATCYEALAAAVQLFHDSAHAYPGAQPLAAAASYDGASPRPDSF